MESIVVGKNTVVYGKDSVVGKDGSSCGLCVVHKRGILECNSAVLKYDGPITILNQIGKVRVLEQDADTIQVDGSLWQGIV